jgi:hypothetical protein
VAQVAKPARGRGVRRRAGRFGNLRHASRATPPRVTPVIHFLVPRYFEWLQKRSPLPALFFLIFAGMGALQPPIVVIQPPIGVIQPPIGVIQPPIGVIQSSIGVIQSPIGVIQSPIGVIQSPIGVIQSPIGVIQSPIGVIQL